MALQFNQGEARQRESLRDRVRERNLNALRTNLRESIASIKAAQSDVRRLFDALETGQANPHAITAQGLIRVLAEIEAIQAAIPRQ